MKKILIIAGVVIGLGVVGVVVLAFFLGNIITAGINKYGPQITQTKVVLAGARVSPLDGIGTLKGLEVGNPKGWSQSNLCSLGEIHVELEPFSVLGDHIIVHEIRIDAAEFNYESKLIASNVGDLLKTIEATVGGGKPAAEAPPITKAGKPVKFEVKKFSMNNGKVHVDLVGNHLTLPMPAIELTDLGTKEGGITPDQFVAAVMRSVTSSVVSAAAKGAGTTSGAAAVEGVKKAGDAIKGLFGGQKK